MCKFIAQRTLLFRNIIYSTNYFLIIQKQVLQHGKHSLNLDGVIDVLYLLPNVHLITKWNIIRLSQRRDLIST